MHDIIFWGLGLDAWLTIAVVLGMFVTMLCTNVKTHVAFFCTMAILCISGVLTIEETFAGYDTSSIITIGLLFPVIAGLRYTGALNWMVNHLMGQPKTYARAIVRLMIPVGFLSSFLSNTATTALFNDIVKNWAKKLGLAPSKLLIPLAYATSFGGVLTLIGTPGNLMIAGMYAKDSHETINIFAPFPVAICCLLASVTFIVLFRRFLPTRTPAQSETDEMMEMEATSTSSKGKTYLSLAIMAGVLVVPALKLMSLPQCCMLACLLVVIFKCCTSEQALKEVDWTILVVFVGSMCIGTAIDKTGIDQKIIETIFSLSGSSPLFTLILLSGTAMLCTEFISDTACAAMFYPITYQAATHLGVNPVPFLIVLMMSTSNNYATPIATPPNTLVYASGGYKFYDFARLGLPLKFINMAIAITVSQLFYPF